MGINKETYFWKFSKNLSNDSISKKEWPTDSLKFRTQLTRKLIISLIALEYCNSLLCHLNFLDLVTKRHNNSKTKNPLLSCKVLVCKSWKRRILKLPTS